MYRFFSTNWILFLLLCCNKHDVFSLFFLSFFSISLLIGFYHATLRQFFFKFWFPTHSTFRLIIACTAKYISLPADSMPYINTKWTNRFNKFWYNNYILFRSVNHYSRFFFILFLLLIKTFGETESKLFSHSQKFGN